MSLVIGLSAKTDVYIGAVRVVVESISSAKSFALSVHLPHQPKSILHITDEHSVEILPNVWVRAGNSGDQELARIVLNAPRDIKIFRGALYRKGAGQQIKSGEDRRSQI